MRQQKSRKVIVCGYGWSGSSAVVDYFSDHVGFEKLGFEFPIVKEPGGLNDLVVRLVHNWDPIVCDDAVKTFRRYCENLDRSNSLSNWNRSSISSKLGVNIMQNVDDFIKKIVSFEYTGDTRFHYYGESLVRKVVRKISRLINSDSPRGRLMYLARPSEDEIVKVVSNFIEHLLSERVRGIGEGYLILDQALSPNSVVDQIRYFSDAKVVIVDRDPRDIFVDLLDQRVLVGSNPSDQDIVDKYIKWHNTIRLNDIKVKNCANIIKINFENFVQNNDGYTNILSDALSFDLVRRLGNQSFKPSESKKNIGLWKGRLAKNVADSIVAQCH